jgi:MFS family permease
MEPLAPTTNAGDSRPILFGPTGGAVVHASEPPRQTGIWGQVRPHLEFATKLLPMTWSVFLFLGGLVFLVFFWSIEFMPELDVKASITLLAVSAITGSMLFIGMAMNMVVPGWFWVSFWGSRASRKNNPERRWYNHVRRLWYRPEFSRGWAFLYFVLPLAGAPVGLCLWPFTRLWWTAPTILVGLTLWLAWKNLPRDLDKKPKRKTMVIFLVSLLFITASVSLPTIILLVLIPTSQPPVKDTIIAFLLLGAYLLVIIAFNAIYVAEGLHDSSWARTVWLWVVAVMLIFFIFLGLGHGAFVPKVVMYIYKFGNVNNASLILDESGCTIAKYHGFQPATVLKEQTCRLDCVKILSRLGSAYYLDTGRHNSLSTRFTIPAQNVISWGIASKGVLDGCAANSSGLSASGSLTPSP